MRSTQTGQPFGRQRPHWHGRTAPPLAQTQLTRPNHQLQPSLDQLPALRQALPQQHGLE